MISSLCKTLRERLGGDKRLLNWIVLAGIAGMVLIALSEWLPDPQTEAVTEQEEPAASTVSDYEADLEQRLEALICQVEGAGEARVMVTLSTSEYIVYATDSETRAGISVGNTVYKIIRLDEIRPSHAPTFSEDFNILLNMATNQKAADAIDAFIDEKLETTYIVIDPLFQKCVFKRDGWVK